MSNIQNKVVLITGASSGIGEAAARLIAKIPLAALRFSCCLNS